MLHIDRAGDFYYVIPSFPYYFDSDTIYRMHRGIVFFNASYNTPDRIKEHNAKLIKKIVSEKHEYGRKCRFLIDYAISAKNFNYVLSTNFFLLRTEKVSKIIKNSIEKNWKTAKYGSEVETGLSEDMLNSYIVQANNDDWYEDGSCGIEFPTPAFSNWNDFEEHMWNLKEAIYEYYGHKYFNPRYGAGGHFNVSSVDFPYNRYNVTMAIYGFAPLMIYLFQKKWTARRDPDFRYIAPFDRLLHNIDEKYHFIHVKDYAYEIRFPDSLYNVDAYLTEAAILTGIVLTATAGKPVAKRLLRYQPDYFYRRMIKDELDSMTIFKSLWKQYTKYAIRYLNAYLSDYFVIFERDTSIDLVSRLNKYVKNPKWRDD